MSLDLGETVLQLDQATQTLRHTYHYRRTRLADLLQNAAMVAGETAISKTQASVDRPYMAAQVKDQLVGSHSPDGPPPDWCAISVDGSHIDVDRHLPIQCYLINLGGCVFTYGSQPAAQFFSEPQLASDPTELYLYDRANPNSEEAITGPLLGILRSVQEMEHLVQKVQDSDPDLPTLALIDGTLVLWGLSGQGYRPFVRKTILQERFLPALEQLRQLAQTRTITLAAYVSLPRTTEVANALRCCLCPYDLRTCQQSCSNRRSHQSPCDQANGFMDREIFQELLAPGCRSPLYRTNPAAAQEYYGEHQVCFYYLNSGVEIARVEVPQWVADKDQLLTLGHSLIVEQCKKGQGYPVAISEAHEQAVISGSDRQQFKQMVEETLQRQGLPTYTSEKERSKSRPWL